MQFVDPHLHRELFGWYSPRLGLDMPIVRYGNWGHGLLLLPTAQADYLEYERFFLIKALEPLLFAGRVTVFSIDSINKHAWMNTSVHPLEAAHRQSMYSAYIEHEVVPHIRRALGDARARIGVAGASFGAFHAANQFFRRPDLFDTLIGMSGFYDLSGDYTKGYWNDDFYFNNPTSYVPNIQDGHTLDLIQNHSQIHLVTGQGSYEKPEASKRFSTLLWNKGIWNNLDLWGHDMPHDWPTWRSMLPHYVGERLGW
jgi:esterase/lipase superfamily enzyme